LLERGRDPAERLRQLYAPRWEIELTIAEWKVQMHDGERLGSYTVQTAAQEIAALLLAHAVCGGLAAADPAPNTTASFNTKSLPTANLNGIGLKAGCWRQPSSAEAPASM
jgi:hypothetical protein